MTDSEIYEALTAVFHAVFFDDTIRIWPEMTADDLAGWDSISHVNLLIAVENRFDIRFDVPEIESMSNVGDFVAMIQRKRQ